MDVVLTYDEAVAALRTALKFGINPSLDGITALCDALGRPQDSFSVVQITGTNGKTSTARLTHALLLAEGRTSGLYTSPELERINERIELAGGPVSDERFAQAVSAALTAAAAVRPQAQDAAGLTEFELTTAAALWAFRESCVDTAVLEVGLGGRWDATSVAAPSVAVITGVGIDHASILGDTLEAIAAEKAAIIRPASAPVLGPGTAGVDAVMLDRAAEFGTHPRVVRQGAAASPVSEELTVRFEITRRPTSPTDSTTVDVRGVHDRYQGLTLRAPAYQAQNLATAIAAAEAALGRALDSRALSTALASVRLAGRFEVVNAEPVVVLDGSHNPQAAAVLAGAIEDAWPAPAEKPVIVLGVLADKDAEGIVAALAPVAAGFVVTQPSSPRALAADQLADVVLRVTGADPLASVGLDQAVLGATEYGCTGTVITGSLTTAGQARVLLRDASATD